MIKTYKIKLKRDKINGVMNQSLAYLLYGELMRRCDCDFAEYVHEQAATPIAQYLTVRNSCELDWTISLFGSNSADVISRVLDTAEEFVIKDRELTLYKAAIEASVTTYDEILNKAVEIPCASRFRVSFNSPTAFKSAGKYVIFPSAALILNNIVASWNAFCSEYSLYDSDMMKMLTDGVDISGYRLSSAVYPMKGVKIPSFCGSVTLNAKLSPPIMKIYNALMIFAEYSGIGIKKSLGMGGTTVENR